MQAHFKPLLASCKNPIGQSRAVVDTDDKRGAQPIISPTARSHCKVAWHRVWVGGQGKETGLILQFITTAWLCPQEWVPGNYMSPVAYSRLIGSKAATI